MMQPHDFLPTERRILATVRGTAWVTTADVARQASIAAPDAMQILRRLQARGLVDRDRSASGQFDTWNLTAAGRTALLNAEVAE